MLRLVLTQKVKEQHFCCFSSSHSDSEAFNTEQQNSWLNVSIRWPLGPSTSLSGILCSFIKVELNLKISKLLCLGMIKSSRKNLFQVQTENCKVFLITLKFQIYFKNLVSNSRN